MTKKYSNADARRNLPILIREAEHAETVGLTRHRGPVAGLVGLQAFEHLIAG